jgi:hypothetical protein
VWRRSLTRKRLPGACLQPVDAGSKLVLQVGHEAARGRDDLLRSHVRSSWRDRTMCAQLIVVEDREGGELRVVEVREYIVPQGE